MTAPPVQDPSAALLAIIARIEAQLAAYTFGISATVARSVVTDLRAVIASLGQPASTDPLPGTEERLQHVAAALDFLQQTGNPQRLDEVMAAADKAGLQLQVAFFPPDAEYGFVSIEQRIG